MCTFSGNSGVLREVWFGLGLSPHLKDLIDNPRFPQTPDEYLVLDKFEAPPNAGDGYGQRLSTYFRVRYSRSNSFVMTKSQDTEFTIEILVFIYLQRKFLEELAAFV